MNTVKERPILFSGDMVRATLREDRPKTQTRRVNGLEKINEHPSEWQFIAVFQDGYARFSNKRTGQKVTLKCPYGGYGDRLWVRETFVIENDSYYSDDGLKDLANNKSIKIIDGEVAGWECDNCIAHYRASEPEPNIVSEEQDADDDRTRWTPSIHMPRWASRILLEITNIRIQRIQGITDEEATAEGKTILYSGCKPTFWFKELWNSIYAKRGHGWDKNDWVWVIGFKRVEAK